ncbi:hypothetical protein KOI35_11830, partial [Actinoplanes bogorensis]
RNAQLRAAAQLRASLMSLNCAQRSTTCSRSTARIAHVAQLRATLNYVQPLNCAHRSCRSTARIAQLRDHAGERNAQFA